MSATTPQALAALALRVGMGIMFIAHGLVLKVMTYGVAGTAAYFESIGYPPLVAYLVIGTEIGGGILLLIGYRVRLVSVLFLPLMIGATAEHVANGWVFSAGDGGWEFPAFWTLALLVQALLGAGAFSMDARAGRLQAPVSAQPA